MIRKDNFLKGAEQGTGDEFEKFFKGDDDLDEALTGGANFEEVADDEDEMVTSFEE
jgi:hypothetical protein